MNIKQKEIIETLIEELQRRVERIFNKYADDVDERLRLEFVSFHKAIMKNVDWENNAQ